MIGIEILSNKLQDLFGGGYVIMPYSVMNTDYTTSIQVNEGNNIGYINQYNDKYTKLRKNKIIGVVNLQNPQRANAMTYYLSSNFIIDFSVPINVNKLNSKSINAKIVYKDNRWGIKLDKRANEDITYNIYVPIKLLGEAVSFRNFAIILKAGETEVYQMHVSGLKPEDYEANKDKARITTAVPETFSYKEFPFLEDYENVCNDILGKTIKYNNDGTLTGKMVLNEPAYQTTESDGEFKYAIYRINGTFSVGKDINFGSDYEIFIETDKGVMSKIEGINSYVEILNNGANAIVKQNSAKTEQNLSQSAWVCTISIDDILEDVASLYLANIVHKNLEILNNEESNSKKRKVHTIITKKGVEIRNFWAIVNITFRTTQNGIGTYDISFTDDNRR